MAKVVVKSKVKKAKKKFPVQITAPEYLNSASLGKSEVTDLGALSEKTVKMNLMYITGNVKNQNIRLEFQVGEVASGLAKTFVKTYEQIPYYLGRFVKKGSDLVDDSFIVESKDGKKVRVKTFIVTKMNTSQMVLSALRIKSREVVAADAKTKSFDEIMAAVIFAKNQAAFRNELKKVFPLKSFEFRKVELIE